MPPSPPLPILAHADAIRGAIADARALVLEAPPGTGKSTQVPQLIAPERGLTVVLQPRRIAARSLAARVAAERGEALGGPIGYSVRFEQSQSAATRVLFATYGVFWQRLLTDPELADVSLVILDEFHERSLEADACLAWLRTLRRDLRPELGLVVMSATLDAEDWLPGAPRLAIAERAHPVTIEYQPAKGHEPVWEQAARAFRHLLSTGERGSVLVFMPGVGEIRRTTEALEASAERAGYAVLPLSGAQSPAEQQRALTEPAERPCVIVATNVAETSLTIPGVTAVIDSGLSRQAAYDAERDLDTLRLGPISLGSATQRAGRAGRLTPGRCVRLWASSLDSSLVPALPPEIARRDLSRLALDAASLPGAMDWLTPPAPDRWALAHGRLAALGAIDPAGHVTPLGRRLLRYPLPPALARVLQAAEEAGVATLVAAMIAIVEAAERKRIADEGDLYLLGLDLLGDAGGRRFGREVTETLKQLTRLARPSAGDRAACLERLTIGEAADLARRRRVTEAWLSAYADRLAFRQERAYQLADGRKAVLASGSAPDLLVALELHEVAGGRGAKQVTVPLYLPCEAAWVDASAAPTVVTSWDAERQRVVQERQWRVGSLTLRREPLPPGAGDARAAEALLVEKLESGEARLPAREDEGVQQLIARLRVAAGVWPELGLPALDAGDWSLLHHALASGRTSVADVKPEALEALIHELVGHGAMARLDRAAPRQHRLPSGRSARITYAEDAPPELAARLGDLVGLHGTLSLYEGRVPVLFDVLAPNFRTVQKTFDMTGFWTGTYPEVKKELKRRYPKHPWP